MFIGIVVVLGTAGIVYSKDQRQPDNSHPRQAKAGQAQDHWHTAIGFDICGTFAPNINDENDPTGIHTHGDGVAHIHPASPLASGKRATLGVFFDAVKAKISSSQIGLPGQAAKKNGDKCGDKSGEVQVKTWANKNPDTQGTTFIGNPADLRPKDGELVTIAFVPKGDDIPRPPSASSLDKLNDVTPTASSTTVPGAAPAESGTTVPGAVPADRSQPTDSTTPPVSSAETTTPPTAPAGTPSPSVP
ncbi:MAG: hypothetical protein M3011_06055 [Actinomycetota bacterium]|nr:hypothetical protein [Actinomycetota bacterium]